MNFRNGKQMMQFLKVCGAFWSPRSEKYVWMYNENGAIAAANVSIKEAIRISNEATSNAWEEFVRGVVYENTSSNGRETNEQFCERVFADGPWFTPTTTRLYFSEEYDRERFEDTCYYMYQLEWMLEEKYSIQDIFDCMKDSAEQMGPEPKSAGDVYDVMIKAFEENGIRGRTFANKEEFLVNEYSDEDYMYELLKNEEEMIHIWLMQREEAKEEKFFEDLVIEEREVGHGEVGFRVQATDKLIDEVNSIRESAGMTDLVKTDLENEVYYNFYLIISAEKRSIQLYAICNCGEKDDYERYDIPLSEEERESLIWKIIRELGKYLG